VVNAVIGISLVIHLLETGYVIVRVGDNNDWKGWCGSRMWNLYKRDNADDAMRTSVSQSSGNTYDDPIFGAHHVVDTIKFCGDMTVRTSHDFLFVGDLCVCNLDKK
jgi:hypothetical protein